MTTADTQTDPIAEAIARHQSGLSAVPEAAAFHAWVAQQRGSWSGLMPGLAQARMGHIDFRSADSAVAAASASMDREGAIRAYEALQQSQGFEMGVGHWMEQRCVYQSSNYASTRLEGAMRDCHLGVDLFAPAGTALRLPLAAEVVVAEVRDIRLDYGGMLVLRHQGPAHPEFFSIWGHLSHASARRWQPGDQIAAGSEFAHLGDFAENGWWLPHLHLQLCLLRLPDFSDAPGVGEQAFAPVWQDIFPNPAPLLRADDEALRS
ncbi:peptidoglycan DD-metalloendopeptidase family protein [Comamonas sp.]|uniref:peptidoglycan DD-metalloendopeptidase family protein n=1 Tax=Comamonas sp. TaxID=34028 RepID=UPI00289A03B1|nr:peptidoglycan DD-metalloendopeptidase family protein [Comamonas sp.]